MKKLEPPDDCHLAVGDKIMTEKGRGEVIALSDWCFIVKLLSSKGIPLRGSRRNPPEYCDLRSNYWIK